ncbi:MAG: lysophospholipid acyltransferase family protein [Pseudomonadota bacterium]
MNPAPWDDGTRPERPMPRGLGRLRATWRLAAIATLLFGLLPVFLICRFLGARGAAAGIVSFAMARALAIMGIAVRVTGRPRGAAALVANHAGWMDIFVLHSVARVVFVSKIEVASWPLIGFVARQVGTVFITRNPREAGEQKAIFEDRFQRGETLLFFPEATSTDGRRVLPFRSSLFAAIHEADRGVQPVSVLYRGPPGGEDRFYGWWGGMDFAPHFLSALGLARQGQVDVIFHPILEARDFAHRKALASAAEDAVRRGVEELLAKN